MAVYSTLRTAYGHMQMLANPLTDAIVKQFPDKFGMPVASTMPAESHTMPTTGMETNQNNTTMTLVGAILGAGLLSVAGIFLLRRARAK